MYDPIHGVSVLEIAIIRDIRYVRSVVCGCWRWRIAVSDCDRERALRGWGCVWRAGTNSKRAIVTYALSKPGAQHPIYQQYPTQLVTFLTPHTYHSPHKTAGNP